MIKQYFAKLKYVWWFVKCLHRFGSVEDGSVCWFSERFFDVHDYPEAKGGDGVPNSFGPSMCHKCGKPFMD